MELILSVDPPDLMIPIMLETRDKVMFCRKTMVEEEEARKSRREGMTTSSERGDREEGLGFD